MNSRFQTSTGAIMLLVVVVALEMVMFQEVWFIVLVPPVTIPALTMNLGLFFLVTRPRALEPRIIGMLLGGAAACFGVTAYMVMTFPSRGTDLGLVGRLMKNALETWATSLPDQQGALATSLRLLSSRARWFEFALLDALGVVVIWAAGRMESELRKGWARSRHASAGEIAALDDRAATPL